MGENPNLSVEFDRYSFSISEKALGELLAFFARSLERGRIPAMSIQHIKLTFGNEQGVAQGNPQACCVVALTVSCKAISAAFSDGYLLNIRDFSINYQFQHCPGSPGFGENFKTMADIASNFRDECKFALLRALKKRRDEEKGLERWIDEARGLVPEIAQI